MGVVVRGLFKERINRRTRRRARRSQVSLHPRYLRRRKELGELVFALLERLDPDPDSPHLPWEELARRSGMSVSTLRRINKEQHIASPLYHKIFNLVELHVELTGHLPDFYTLESEKVRERHKR